MDGDLVESLLDIPREKARKIVENIRLPNQGIFVRIIVCFNFFLDEKLEGNAENVLKLIEDLSRIH